MNIGVITYFIIGLILTFYWYERDYHKEYVELEKTDGVEKGTGNIFLLILWFFWPINMIKNIIKYKKV
jgi:hypothetical protein